jgi:gamma-glutamyltranspeptidase / glutathione hydrolase
MNFPSSTQYVSRRSPVFSRRGMVASSQPEATNAGLQILRAGGNAADAAVAVAAALQVTQPCSTGLGGDCFCLYFSNSEKKVIALNGSGKSPAALTMDLIRKGYMEAGVPNYHPYTVNVPGAPAGWADTVGRLGTLDLAKVLGPAIELAEAGFPVAPVTSHWWAGGAERQLSLYKHGHELTIDGRAPQAGEIFRNPGLAKVLRTLAEEGSAPFYSGRIAEKIVAAVQEEGGVLTLEDLADHSSAWIEPISTVYRDTRVWECPPNGQGIAALIALNILEQFELDAADATTRYHLMIESMRLAFADAGRYVADPDSNPAPIDELLSKGYAKRRAQLINPKIAMKGVEPGSFPGGAGADTVYFSVADAEGNGCSFINSNYMGFGTGIVPEGCGYSLQNRGKGFTLEEDHPNCLGPKKRGYHTIIPGLATHATTGELFCVFGVMGGHMQPQGHMQVVHHLVDEDFDPQAALDAPRFNIRDAFLGGPVLLEDSAGADVAHELATRGHEISVVSGLGRGAMGLGQIIMRHGKNVYCGGSDPRGDGLALGE